MPNNLELTPIPVSSGAKPSTPGPSSLAASTPLVAGMIAGREQDRTEIESDNESVLSGVAPLKQQYSE